MKCTSTHLGTLPEAYRWTSIYQEALHPPWWRDQFFDFAYTSTTPCPTELYEIVWAIQLYSLYSVYIFIHNTALYSVYTAYTLYITIHSPSDFAQAKGLKFCTGGAYILHDPTVTIYIGLFRATSDYIYIYINAKHPGKNQDALNQLARGL